MIVLEIEGFKYYMELCIVQLWKDIYLSSKSSEVFLFYLYMYSVLLHCDTNTFT